MKWPTLRLLVAAALFLAWLGWLGYLVWTSAHPIVLSRPQLLVSSLDVIAQVDQTNGGPAQEVTVKAVHWPHTDQAKVLVAKKITVSNLSEAEGWTQPGEYILPLMTDWQGHYTVAPTPPSPGYSRGGRPRIYPATPQTLEQLRAIAKPGMGPP